jgi:hypothetical protein
MRGFCGLDGPGPDTRFGGCHGRRRQDGHHWRQFCRHTRALSGVGAPAGASAPTSQPAQPSIDINRAQQPGIGVNGGAGVGR